jgi:IstB-like ATP binding protein
MSQAREIIRPKFSASRPTREIARRLDLAPSTVGETLSRLIGDPTYADAILDRLIHNAHRIGLADKNLRRTQAKRSRKA